MKERGFRIAGDKVIGQLPSGEVHEYDSILDYLNAYKAEEDEIAEELFRLELELQHEYA